MGNNSFSHTRGKGITRLFAGFCKVVSSVASVGWAHGVRSGAKRRSQETKSRGSTQMVEINHLSREISRVDTVQILNAESDTNLL